MASSCSRRLIGVTALTADSISLVFRCHVTPLSASLNMLTALSTPCFFFVEDTRDLRILTYCTKIVFS